jgi:hypothetical protein
VVLETVQKAAQCHQKIVELKVDHLKFRIGFIKGLLVKYSVWHKVPGHVVMRDSWNGIFLGEHSP